MQITRNINPNIFREYDIRGIYGTELTEDIAYTIGKSFGTYIQTFNQTKTIIGHDNRLSSPVLKEALIKGITETGINVIDLGLVTTPMYYYARQILDLETGIMITASHNPREYNGFKIAFNKISNAYGEYISKFRDFTLSEEFKEGKGTVEPYNIKEQYLELIEKSLDFKDKPKVVVDCGNGTGSIIIEDILKRLNITYELLYCESDGNFPNHHPDPSDYKNLKELSEKVKELNYDIGIGIDGDADRVGVVDEKGNIIPVDILMAIIYRYLNPTLKNRSALFDVKCSKSLIDELEKLNIKPVMYRTGNSYSCMMMKKGNFDFGGEYSGHLFFSDKFPTIDDGIYNGLRIMEIISQTNKKLSELEEPINKYHSTPELKFKTTDDKKHSIIEIIKEYCQEKNYDIITIDGVRINFNDGWALVRCSNTGPNLTARFEATTNERLQEIEAEFTNLIEKNL